MHSPHKIAQQKIRSQIKYTILSVYYMAQPAAQHLTQLGIESFWEKPSPDPPIKVGKTANASKISSSKRKHYIGYFTGTQARERLTSFRANLWKYNHWFFCPIVTRAFIWKGTAENELVESVSKTNRNRSQVWW